MIPNITFGSDAVGLATYLVGEGRANEHEEPHLVAGSPQITAWFDDRTLTHQDAIELGREIDQPHEVYGTQVEGGHVRHISLSLHKEDGQLTDDEWQELAEDFVQRMGYVGVEGKADARWAAVRHGLSGRNQNDHVHLMVSYVREDGTKVSTWKDMPHSQTVARELEEAHHLFRVGQVLSARGYTPREVAAAEARGRTEPERDTLERSVRACATAAVTEDEFVRRLRGDGLRVRANTDEHGAVRGYAVALHPPADQRAIYYGGTKLAKDLGLGTLRKQWEDTPENRSTARGEWEAASRGLRIVAPGREQSDPQFTTGQLATQLGNWNDRLARLDPGDHEGWRAAAGELSGVFAAWSRATEPAPGPLADVSKELSRSAQMRRGEYTPAKVNAATGAYTATALMFMATQDDARANLAVFKQLSRLTAAIRDHQNDTRDRVRVNGLERVARERLIGLNEAFHAYAGITTPAPAPTRGPAPERASVLGPKLERTATAATTRTTDRDTLSR